MTYFDEQAKDWDSDPMRTERATAVAEAIRTTLPLTTRMSALEYGCGTGVLSFLLQPHLASITLADTSQGMLDVLSDKINTTGVKNMRPLKLDLVSDPLPASSFDITYSLMTLHHIPQIDPVLRKFYALLAPGGWLCIADLDAEDGSFHTPDTAGIHNGFERQALQKQVEATGFREINYTTPYKINKPVNGTNRVFPLFLLTARKPLVC